MDGVNGAFSVRGGAPCGAAAVMARGPEVALSTEVWSGGAVMWRSSDGNYLPFIRH